MKEYAAVVFDMDGVIFDSERCMMECWLELAEKYGLEDLRPHYLACTGTNVAKTRQIMLDAYGADFPYERFAKEASVLFHGRYDHGKLPMKRGVFEILDYLKGQGKKLALASSTKRETVTMQLREAGVLEYFAELVCGDMVERSKPAPDIFLRACEVIGVRPEDAYAIEDSYNGIRAAHAGHLRPIMVPDLRPADEEMRSLAEAVLPSLPDVVEYLRN
ncbi:MAG: HAD family phosphatase [Lachnospiraceae bacterium]|jgi:HAD superfamily hydrolase (TIGR01509 family)|nr:HAD family phosphatase [Lachnospiraceae bacterium]